MSEKSPVLFSKEEFYEWLSKFERRWDIEYTMPHEQDWLICIAVLVPGEHGCAEIMWVYYHEFQSAFLFLNTR